MNNDPLQPRGRGTGWVIAQIPFLVAATVLPVMEVMSDRREPGSRARTTIARAAGLSGMLVSLTLLWQASRVLGRGLVPYPKPPAGAILRQTGIYGRVRHPIYLGILCAIFSWALCWRSRDGLALFVPSIAFFWAKSRHEERFLRAQFPEYAEYQRRVPALVPRCRLRPAAGK
ncbi:MAG: isoprenylcysteine carboxylmethyltransferase family protein [Chloroflexota bacterium]